MEELTDEEFTKEMKILWQNCTQDRRISLGSIIKGYYTEGSRAERIISKLQEGY